MRVDALEQAVHDPDVWYEVRDKCIEAIGNIKVEKSVDILINMLSNRKTSIKAMKSLANFGDLALDKIIQVLGSGDDFLIRRASAALYEHNPHSYLPKICDILLNQEHELQETPLGFLDMLLEVLVETKESNLFIESLQPLLEKWAVSNNIVIKANAEKLLNVLRE